MVISPTVRSDGTLTLPFKLDAGVGARGSIGLIVLASDQTIEHEFRRWLDIDGVAVHQSRIANDNHITPDTLKAMEGRIAEATALILPGAPLEVVAYGCTSASMLIGEERVFDRIRSVRPHVACTTPITAAFSAFRTFEAKRIALLTPYRADVNDAICAYIETRDIEVPAIGSFHEEDDRRVCQISEASIFDAAMILGQSRNIDAIFVSCTALRTAGVIAGIESALGKPVTSSNHALAWHCLRLAGVEDRRCDAGRLFQLDLCCDDRH
ncbi:MAG: maleate cis-trans isomerase family protein [Geminicoccaceae bacterium]|jgi:maleate isomerase